MFIKEDKEMKCEFSVKDLKWILSSLENVLDEELMSYEDLSEEEIKGYGDVISKVERLLKGRD